MPENSLRVTVLLLGLASHCAKQRILACAVGLPALVHPQYL